MAFPDLLAAAQKYFPALKVKIKSESPLMKFLGALMFFNKGFMLNYLTTIGSTIYAPTEKFFVLHPVSGAVVFMHELVHLHDQKKIGKVWFQLSYLLPQILALPALLLFLLSWKIALPVILFFLLPLPSYFRMKYERRAYYTSIYAIKKLSERLNFDPHLDTQGIHFAEYFADSTYYFMWPFKNIMNDDFNNAIQLVQAGKRPFEDPVFDMIDDLVTKV